ESHPRRAPGSASRPDAADAVPRAGPAAARPDHSGRAHPAGADPDRSGPPGPPACL
ncbi:MAG: hypothetical protein AVDCRST_MAG07-1124, partial [uncultured Frankineae bacterium]